MNGETGETGKTGATGARGRTGETGARGKTGATGKWWPPSPTVVVIYTAIAASIAALVGGITAYRTSEANQDRIEDIEAVQLDACEGRNTLRTIIRVQLQRQIDESIANEKSGLLAEFFPDIPPDQLHQVIEESRDDLRGDKAKLANEDCSGL